MDYIDLQKRTVTQVTVSLNILKRIYFLMKNCIIYERISHRDITEEQNFILDRISLI